METYLYKVKKEESDILYRLLQYSLFEESETDLNEMNEEAIFEYKWFDNYFYDADRFAYFVKLENKIVGFVMINKYLEKSNPENVHVEDYVAIIKKNRSNGLIVGKESIFMSFNNDEEIAETNYKELKDLIFPQSNEVESKK